MPPKKKISTEEQKPALLSAATTTSHPLQGKTVVFNGTFKAKKKVCEARVAELGGRSTTKVSSKTHYFVKGKGAGVSIVEAIQRDIPVWSEEQFDAVCKDGWSAVPPPRPMPPILQCLVDAPELSEECRKATINRLTFEIYDNEVPQLLFMQAGGGLWARTELLSWPQLSRRGRVHFLFCDR